MQKNIIWVAVIAGIAFVLATVVLSNGIKNRNQAEDMIQVTGLGTVDFVSDEIMWRGSFQVKSMDAKEAYSRILADKEKVRQFFISKGFSDDEMVFGGANIEKAYRNVTIKAESSYETRSETILDGYIATQTVTFTAKKNPGLMAKIEKVSDKTSELVNSGIEFNGQSIQYTYSELPSLKHALIEKATKDARERADKVIHAADGKRGKLKSASMGVFQITGVGSNVEDSYGGNFDLYSKEKTARITVRLNYNLQ